MARPCSFEPEEPLYSYFPFRDDIMQQCLQSVVFCAVSFCKFTLFHPLSHLHIFCRLPIPLAILLLKKKEKKNAKA